MEKNLMYNKGLMNSLANAAVGAMLEQKMISESDLNGLSIKCGYLFSTEDEKPEGLFKVETSDHTEYFGVQNGSLMFLNIDETVFEDLVTNMKKSHPCLLEEAPEESESQIKRREKNNRYLRENGLAASDGLRSHWEDSEVSCREKDEICKRAAACLITVQVACDINNGKYKESIEYFVPMLKDLGLMEKLNSKEMRIIDGSYSMKDAVDLDWAYESYWALCWCLGLVDDIRDASDICDCDAAIGFFMHCRTVDEFIAQCKLRSREEILDMLDLYFRYQWAVNDSRVNPASSAGSLNPMTVTERRRALEWVVSDEEDWYDLDMFA